MCEPLEAAVMGAAGKPEQMVRLYAAVDALRATLDAPQMLTGEIEGRFLEFLVFLAQPLMLIIGGAVHDKVPQRYSNPALVAFASSVVSGVVLLVAAASPSSASRAPGSCRRTTPSSVSGSRSSTTTAANALEVIGTAGVHFAGNITGTVNAEQLFIGNDWFSYRLRGSATVRDAGFAPNLKSNEEAVETIIEAIEKAGYSAGSNVMLALDPAATELYADGRYTLVREDRSLTGDELITLQDKLDHLRAEYHKHVQRVEQHEDEHHAVKPGIAHAHLLKGMSHAHIP